MPGRNTLGLTNRAFVVLALIFCATPGFTKDEPAKDSKKTDSSSSSLRGLTEAQKKLVRTEMTQMAKSFHEQQYVHGEADYQKSKVNKLTLQASDQLQSNKPDAAIDLLTKAIAECDTPEEKALYKTKSMANFVKSQTYLARGVCRLKQKKLSEAEKDFTESIRCCPDYSTPYMFRAKTLMAENKSALANDDIAKASNLRSAPPFVYKSMASVKSPETDRLLIKSAVAQTEKYYVGGIKGQEASQMEKCYLDGHKLRDAGNYVAAIDKFTAGIVSSGDAKEKALYKSKDMYNYIVGLNYENRAFCYLMLKNWKKAIDDLSKEIELRPNHKESYINRGKAYQSMGKEKEAAADFATAKALKPNSIPKFLTEK